VTLQTGQLAPDFALRNQYGQHVTLSQFRGSKNVLLMFYPFAFTGTCTGELCALRDERKDFDNDDSVLLSVSCDPVSALRVFAEQEKLESALLSDFWPHGAVSRAYGVFLEDKGCANRGTFVIDKEGIVRWQVVTSMGQARSTDDYRQALADIA